jgi:hypothetical protein
MKWTFSSPWVRMGVGVGEGVRVALGVELGLGLERTTDGDTADGVRQPDITRMIEMSTERSVILFICSNRSWEIG